MRGSGENPGVLHLSPQRQQSHNGGSPDSARTADPKLIQFVKALARAAAERDFNQSRENSGQTDE